MIKVTRIEKLGNIDVVKGKLICGDVGAFGKMMDSDELHGKLRPIIISESEDLEAGATVAFNDGGAVRIGKIISRKATGKFWICDFNGEHETTMGDRLFKILASPEEFSAFHLRMIADGKLRNEEDVLIECEEVPIDVANDCWDELKGTKNGICNVINVLFDYIIIHKINNQKQTL